MSRTISQSGFTQEAFDAFLRHHWKVINKSLTASGAIREAATKPE